MIIIWHSLINVYYVATADSQEVRGQTPRLINNIPGLHCLAEVRRASRYLSSNRIPIFLSLVFNVVCSPQ